MVSPRYPIVGLGRERGQASLLLLGVMAALLAGTLILFGFGQALGARGKHQRAADLAAVSGAQVMRRHYARLFEPALLADGVPNPRHLSNSAYLALARDAAVEGARRNGVPPGRVSVMFPDAGFAPNRITVDLRGRADVSVPPGDRTDQIEVRAHATAELTLADEAGFGMPGLADGSGYRGPLAYRQGKPMRPDVALAFDRLAAAARRAPRGGAIHLDHERLSLGRRAGEAVGRQPRPEVGRETRHQPPPVRHRARPRASVRLRLARRERRALRVPAPVQLGALALRVAISPHTSVGRGSDQTARREGPAAGCELGHSTAALSIPAERR